MKIASFLRQAHDKEVPLYDFTNSTLEIKLGYRTIFTIPFKLSTMTRFELQPLTLKNELVQLQPLADDDFERLYKVASDPMIWEQHPNKERYQRAVFENYFTGAMQSGGAFVICDAKTGEAIGSSRFYEHDPVVGNIKIGYTFLARNRWGGPYNRTVKTLMLDHAFRFVDVVVFHIGAQNIRSQMAIEKLGARKTGEIEIEYFGEPKRLNCVYQVDKKDWEKVEG